MRMSIPSFRSAPLPQAPYRPREQDQIDRQLASMPRTAVTAMMCSHCCYVWILQSVHMPACFGVQATFLEGSQITAVTADSRGRLVFHNVTAYLSLTSIFTGLTKGAQPSLLTEGRQLGPLCVLAGLPAPRTPGPPPADAGRPHFIQDGAAQHVWDGMLIMCSAKGAFIGAPLAPKARFRSAHCAQPGSPGPRHVTQMAGCGGGLSVICPNPNSATRMRR